MNQVLNKISYLTLFISLLTNNVEDVNLYNIFHIAHIYNLIIN